jgi:hypothetical protein
LERESFSDGEILTVLGMALDRGDYYKSRWRGGVAVIRRATLGLARTKYGVIKEATDKWLL